MPGRQSLLSVTAPSFVFSQGLGSLDGAETGDRNGAPHDSIDAAVPLDEWHGLAPLESAIFHLAASHPNEQRKQVLGIAANESAGESRGSTWS